MKNENMKYMKKLMQQKMATKTLLFSNGHLATLKHGAVAWQVEDEEEEVWAQAKNQQTIPCVAHCIS
jgi:hypothetical protein